MNFSAGTVRVVEEDGVTILALGDSGEKPTVGVILSISEDIDEQDRKLGIDGIHFECIAPSCSGYRMLRDLTLGDKTIKIDLREHQPGIGNFIEIELQDQTLDRSILERTVEKMTAHVF